MILLQLLAFIILLPLNAMLFVIFNAYLMNWIFSFLMLLFTFTYAFFCGLLFQSASAAIFVFMIISVCYFARRNYLFERLQAKNTEPLLHGSVKYKRFELKFILLLSWLNIFKRLPERITRKMHFKNELNIQVPELIDVILTSCVGTQVHVATDELEFNFEIK